MTAVRKEVIGDCTLYLGDCRDVLPELTGPIHAVVTSPPYDQQRQYGLKQFTWRQTVCTALTKVRDADAQILVNLGLVHRNGNVVRYWDALIGEMEGCGWKLFGWYVWDQGPGMVGDWNGRLAPAHEWVFHFNKTPRRPNKTVPCSYAGHVRATPQGGLRRADGTMSGWSHGTVPTQENKIPDSVIRIVRHKHTGGIEAGHPAVFPVRFAAELILAYTDRGDVVVDPFLGSGTSGVAAVQEGRRFVGIEVNEEYFEIACERIRAAVAQPDIFLEADRQAAPIQEQLFQPSPRFIVSDGGPHEVANSREQPEARVAPASGILAGAAG